VFEGPYKKKKRQDGSNRKKGKVLQEEGRSLDFLLAKCPQLNFEGRTNVAQGGEKKKRERGQGRMKKNHLLEEGAMVSLGKKAFPLNHDVFNEKRGRAAREGGKRWGRNW